MSVKLGLVAACALLDRDGRVMIAQALSASFGREGLPSDTLNSLCSSADLDLARQWGLAMRLGQKLSGGVGSALQLAQLGRIDGTIELSTTSANAALVGPAVRKRLEKVAEALGCAAEVRTVTRLQ